MHIISVIMIIINNAINIAPVGVAAAVINGAGVDVAHILGGNTRSKDLVHVVAVDNLDLTTRA